MRTAETRICLFFHLPSPLLAHEPSLEPLMLPLLELPLPDVPLVELVGSLALLELELLFGVGVPVISTRCPTCSLRSTVAPAISSTLFSDAALELGSDMLPALELPLPDVPLPVELPLPDVPLVELLFASVTFVRM